MTSNTIVAMRDVVQMCFVGFSIQTERADVAKSVALFTHSFSFQNVVSLIEEHTQE